MKKPVSVIVGITMLLAVLVLPVIFDCNIALATDFGDVDTFIISVTGEDDDRETKLRKVWDDLSSRESRSSQAPVVDMASDDWANQIADRYLESGEASFCSLDALFAKVAARLGYDSLLIVGTTYANHASKTGHKPASVVIIDGMYYSLSVGDADVYAGTGVGTTFFPEAGNYPRTDTPLNGICKIAGYVYGFDSTGHVVRGSQNKTRIKTINGDKILVDKYGRAKKTGIILRGGKLYCFRGDNNTALKNKIYKEIPFGPSGYGKSCLNTSLKIRTMRILNRITRKKDSKSVKLKKVFIYMLGRRFHYEVKYPDLKDKSWIKRYADYMLKTGGGNCYGFACTFAALAYEIGYNPIVVTGRVHGSRDRARDGYTRHTIVKINGKYYDPELSWKHNDTRYYARSTYPLHMKQKKNWKYKDSLGFTDELNTGLINAGKVVLKHGKYYYYSNSGTKKTGIYYIKNRLYNFNSDGYMTKELYKIYQAAIKEGAPYDGLKALIGEAVSVTNQGESCYAVGGEDYVYDYNKFKVYVFHSSSGEEIIESLSVL